MLLLVLFGFMGYLFVKWKCEPAPLLLAFVLEPIIEQRRLNPGRDLLSDLVTAEYDGQPLPHEEIVSNIIFLLAAGVETTERVLTSTWSWAGWQRSPMTATSTPPGPSPPPHSP